MVGLEEGVPDCGAGTTRSGVSGTRSEAGRLARDLSGQFLVLWNFYSVPAWSFSFRCLAMPDPDAPGPFSSLGLRNGGSDSRR